MLRIYDTASVARVPHPLPAPARAVRLLASHQRDHGGAVVLIVLAPTKITAANVLRSSLGDEDFPGRYLRALRPSALPFLGGLERCALPDGPRVLAASAYPRDGDALVDLCDQALLGRFIQGRDGAAHPTAA